MTDLNSTSDHEILRILNKGDTNGITLLHDKYSEQLFISAYNMLKNREASEDLIQEIFIRIWNKRKNLKIKTSLKSYLYASVIHGVYAHFRKNRDKFNVQLLEGFNTYVHNNNPETELIQQEIIFQINSVIDSLPEKCRIVFKLSREEQLSHKEIAQKLNISTKTIETHITKALKAIRFSLGETYSIEIITFLYYTMNL